MTKTQPATRREKLRLIHRWTHRDFKGRVGGIQSLLLNRQGATQLVPLDELTDAEIDERLPLAIARQARFEARNAPLRPLTVTEEPGHGND